MPFHPDEKLIKRPQDDAPLTKKEKNEWLKCASDKDYFFKKYVYIQGENGRELFNPRDYQWEIINAAEAERFTVNLAGRQCGKALALDTLVPTPMGTVKIGKIHPGDFIYSDEGLPVIVTHISDIMYDHICYEILFSTGDKVIADEDHLWTVKYGSRTYKQTLSTRDIISMGVETGFSIDRPYPLSSIDIISIKKTESVPVRCIRVNNYSHLFCITESMIPTHNTTTMGADVLYDTVFQQDYPVLITSYKGKNVRDYMNRIRFMYENLPWWLKPPVTAYNMSEIRFSNGSSIFAEVTNESTGRGTTQKRIISDELAFVDPKVSHEFMASLLPSISAAGELSQTRFNIISSANGTEGIFASIWFGANAGENGFYPVEVPYEKVPGRTPVFEKSMVDKIGRQRFDREFRNVFISSSGTLVNSRILESIKTAKEPKKQFKDLEIYVDSFKNRKLAIIGDISEGIGEDYSTLEIVDIDTFEQCAEYSNNMVNQTMFVTDLIRIMRMLDEEGAADLYYSFENNGIGAGVARLIEGSSDPILDKATLISDPPTSEGKFRIGIYMTAQKKAEGCGQLKDMIELSKLHINSRKLITELKFFVKRKASFAAAPGMHDDRVMCMVNLMIMLKYIGQYEEGVDEIMNDIDEESADEVFGIYF